MHTTTTLPARPANGRHARPVWLVSACSGIAAAAAAELYGAAARAAGVPMAAAAFGADAAKPITLGMFAMGTLICAFWGTVLAVIFARRAAHPARAYLRTTIALTALSLAMPLSAAHTAASTKGTLAIAHLLAAALIIPAVTKRLGHASSGRMDS